MKRLLSLVAVLAISPITLAQDAKLVSGVELEYVSKELAPQDDFYSYVNEGWLKNTEIPSDQSNWGSFSVIDDEVKSNIRAIIETAAASEAEMRKTAEAQVKMEVESRKKAEEEVSYNRSLPRRNSDIDFC